MVARLDLFTLSVALTCSFDCVEGRGGKHGSDKGRIWMGRAGRQNVKPGIARTSSAASQTNPENSKMSLFRFVA